METTKKNIKLGDIVRVRHNISCHQFKENTLGIVKEVYPRYSETPKRYKVVTDYDWWWVDPYDITLFERCRNEEDY